MLATAIIAFTTFFATIGPIDVAAIFAVLTSGASARHRLSMAVRGVLIAAIILLIFAGSGRFLLDHLGISLAALRTAGGILLLLIGIDMTFARESGGVSATADERHEASLKNDIAVFPLATPLIAGPGAMGAAILLVANAGDSLELKAVVIAALLLVLLLTFACLIGASQIQRYLGVTGLHVISRIFGVLLTALAVQFMFDGIAQSNIFTLPTHI